jgi:predicted ABC-type ATPase
VKTQLSAKKSFIVESTLSGHSLVKHIENAKKAGFRIELWYVYLENASLCNNRINERVKKGGHFVPPEDVERRFIFGTNNAH